MEIPLSFTHPIKGCHLLTLSFQTYDFCRTQKDIFLGKKKEVIQVQNHKVSKWQSLIFLEELFL